MAQSFGGAFGNEIIKVWAWFLPAVMPGLLLTVGLFYFDPNAAARGIDKVVFRVALWGSVLYLCAVSIALFGHPFLVHPTDIMQSSRLWLGPIQGAVVSAIALFFVGAEVVSKQRK